MNSEKYIGLDVHQATISVAVLDSTGKLVMESILETSAATILQFFAGLRGRLLVTFEESTSAAWLYDLLKPHVAELLVCNPRKNFLLNQGNKSDRIDARKLAELLRGGQLKPVYHGETGVRTLRELARAYLTTVKDLTRVMARLKAVYRSWAVPCAGRAVYYRRYRAEWLGEDPAPRTSPPRRATLRTVGRARAIAAASKAGAAAREPPAFGNRPAAADSVCRADPGRAAGGADPDAASFPHQAATVGL